MPATETPPGIEDPFDTNSPTKIRRQADYPVADGRLDNNVVPF